MKKGLIFAFIVVAVTVIISCFGVGLNMESAFAGNVLSENESSRNNGRGMAVYEQAMRGFSTKTVDNGGTETVIHNEEFSGVFIDKQGFCPWLFEIKGGQNAVGNCYEYI